MAEDTNQNHSEPEADGTDVQAEVEALETKNKELRAQNEQLENLNNELTTYKTSYERLTYVAKRILVGWRIYEPSIQFERAVKKWTKELFENPPPSLINTHKTIQYILLKHAARDLINDKPKSDEINTKADSLLADLPIPEEWSPPELDEKSISDLVASMLFTALVASLVALSIAAVPTYFVYRQTEVSKEEVTAAQWSNYITCEQTRLFSRQGNLKYYSSNEQTISQRVIDDLSQAQKMRQSLYEVIRNSKCDQDTCHLPQEHFPLLNIKRLPIDPDTPMFHSETKKNKIDPIILSAYDYASQHTKNTTIALNQIRRMYGRDPHLWREDSSARIFKAYRNACLRSDLHARSREKCDQIDQMETLEKIKEFDKIALSKKDLNKAFSKFIKLMQEIPLDQLDQHLVGGPCDMIIESFISSPNAYRLLKVEMCLSGYENPLYRKKPAFRFLSTGEYIKRINKATQSNQIKSMGDFTWCRNMLPAEERTKLDEWRGVSQPSPAPASASPSAWP